MFLRTLSNLTLNISREGASTTSQGNLSQCFTTLIIKKFILCIKHLNISKEHLKSLKKYWNECSSDYTGYIMVQIIRRQIPF